MTTAGGLYLPQVDFTAKASDIGTVVPQETLNAVSTPPSQQQAQCAAIDTPIPVTYGTDRIGARVADLAIHNGRLVMFVVWGYGPYDGLVNFTIDDAAPPAGVTATHYDGTQVAADPTLAAIYGGGYADVLANVVYSVVQIPAGATAGFPQLAATWRGRKLHDHRSGLTVWSDNPSLALADYLASTAYGMGKTLDWASVDAAANANDALVGGVKRRTFGLTLDTRQEAGAWRDTLRTYAGCWLLDDGQSVRLVPDRPGTPVAHFSHDLGNLKSLAALQLRGLKDVPTVMEIAWTDTSQTPWREAIATAKAAGVDAGTTPVRLSRVALPGIRDAAQANREAIERLNKLTLADLSTEIEVFDEAVVIEPGDVVQVSHPVGLSAKPFRVTGVDGQLGRYKLKLDEYDPACWSDSVATISTYPDTNLPNPASPPVPTGLVVTEEVYQQQDGTWSSRIKAAWSASTWPYLTQYRFEVWESGQLVHATTGTAAEARSPAIQEGKTYTVKVANVSSVGAASAWAQDSLMALGKYLLPSDVPSVSAFEAGGTVYVSWQPAIDLDIWRYEVRRWAVGQSWDGLTWTVDRVDGLRVTSDQVPVGTWVIGVKAIDSVGQYSVNAATAQVTVTSDAAAFFVDSRDQTAPTLTNMAAYTLGPVDANTYYVTEDGVAFGTKFSSPMASYTNALATYHGAVTSTWLGEPEDFGQMLGGQWTGTATVTDLGGSHASYLGLSADGAAWTYHAGLSQKQNGRFGRMKHEATGAATLLVTAPAQNIRLDAIPREEVGTGTSSAAGPTTITLSNAYVAAKKLTITAQGTTARSATYDNIVLGTPTRFDVYVFDAAGNKIASPFRYEWQGV